MKRLYVLELDDKLLPQLLLLPGKLGRALRSLKPAADEQKTINFSYIPKRIAIPLADDFPLLEIKWIVYLACSGKSTTFYYFEYPGGELKKLTTGHNIGHYDGRKELYYFKRANQTFIVNPSYVSSIQYDNTLAFKVSIPHIIEITDTFWPDGSVK